MAWGRLDDGYYDHPKVLKALDSDAGAVGLHCRAIAYCAKHQLDGHLSERAVCSLMPLQSDREKAVAALLDAGLLERNGDSYVVHDFLDYNPSREEVIEKRRKDRERKAT